MPSIKSSIERDNAATETAYLSAIPGMDETIIEGLNTPLSECVPIEEVLIEP
ncbi:MAG: hypothetical protein FWG68_11620 [Defluviitaleaceae bacterium]|nr:hypothetical protein [Defluviitaleaceae bacterium]